MEQSRKDFEQIYNATYDKVLYYVLMKCGKSLDVEEILQETYTELYKVLTDKGKDYITSPEGFVMQLAKSKIHLYYSEKERRKACIYVENMELLESEGIYGSIDTTQTTKWEDSLLDQLTTQEVMAYISTKDELTKEIFYQHYFEEKTLKEIADAHGVKESAVKNRLYRTLKELKGMKRFAFVAAILLLAALLAKPVYSLAEDVISQIKRYLTEDTQNTLEIISYGSMYRDYKKLIEKGELPADIHININGEDYTFEKLEEIWVSNPWLEELDWENKKESTADEIDYYIVIYEDDNVKNDAVGVEAGEIIVVPTKTPDK